MSEVDIEKLIKKAAAGKATEEELELLPAKALRELAGGVTAPKTEAAPKQTEEESEPVEEEAEVDEEEEEEDEPAEDKFTRTIDLGDGSGVQVFKAPTMEALLDKMAEAQMNATKKIRQQAADLKKFAAQKAKDDADNEYITSQELMSKPTEAFKKLFKETTGVEIETFKNTWERVEAFEAAHQKQEVEDVKAQAATVFVESHPEFIPNKSNGTKLERAVNLLVAEAERTGKPINHAAFLEEAYKDLSESGLLQLKVKEAEPEAEPQAPVKTVPVQAHVRRSSGLSSRVRTTTTPKSTEPTEDELYSMPLDKLKELAIKKSRQ